VICKFDADIILPENYLQTIHDAFQNNPKYGLVGGLLYVEKKENGYMKGIPIKTRSRTDESLQKRML
jgi:cellulose synthase/poly-beta-1,6-N-acetylglucosamine synthase-like glycosyltransferase